MEYSWARLERNHDWKSIKGGSRTGLTCWCPYPPYILIYIYISTLIYTADFDIIATWISSDMHTCACLMYIYGCFHRIGCLTSPHTSIQKGIHKRGGGAKRRLLSVEAPRSAAPFLDGCVWAGEAADAMETSINMYETCACMHITRDSWGINHDLILWKKRKGTAREVRRIKSWLIPF